MTDQRARHDLTHDPSHRVPGTARTAGAARAVDAIKVYGKGEATVRALDGVSVEFAAGQFTAIMGPSGSGKSTLMHCVAGLDDLTERLRLDRRHRARRRSTDKKLTQLRRDRIGFVFQAFNLLPTLDGGGEHHAADAPRRPQARPGMGRHTSSTPSGLRDRLKHRPSELSGGQQQRVAVARALASQPEIVFADEPTGNLDSRTGAEILSFMRQAVREFGQTIVMVTHDPVAASYADRAVFLADGRIVDDLHQPDRRLGPRPHARRLGR